MEDNQKISLTRDELNEIVSECIHATFTQLGLDHKHPLEMQRDFQYLRDWRSASEQIKTKGLLVLVVIVVTGTLGALWIGFKNIVLQ